MKFEIYISNIFRRQAKRLIRKYPSLKKELDLLYTALSENHTMGSPIGKNCYKIRIAVKSKGKGKSGGLRVLTWLLYQIKNSNNKKVKINLVTIYDKSEFETVSDKKLTELIKIIFSELNL